MKKTIVLISILLTLTSTTAFSAAVLASWYIGATFGPPTSDATTRCIAYTCKEEVIQAAKNDALAFLNGEGPSTMVQTMIESFRRHHPALRISNEAIAAQIIAESNKVLNP